MLRALVFHIVVPSAHFLCRKTGNNIKALYVYGRPLSRRGCSVTGEGACSLVGVETSQIKETRHIVQTHSREERPRTARVAGRGREGVVVATGSERVNSPPLVQSLVCGAGHPYKHSWKYHLEAFRDTELT